MDNLVLVIQIILNSEASWFELLGIWIVDQMSVIQIIIQTMDKLSALWMINLHVTIPIVNELSAFQITIE